MISRGSQPNDDSDVVGDVVDIPTVKSDSHDPSTILPLFSLPPFL